MQVLWRTFISFILLLIGMVVILPFVTAANCGNNWCEQGEQTSCQQDCPASAVTWQPTVKKEHTVDQSLSVVEVDTYNNSYVLLGDKGNTPVLHLYGTNGSQQRTTTIQSSCTGFGCSRVSGAESVLFDNNRIVALTGRESLGNKRKVVVYDNTLQKVAADKITLMHGGQPVNVSANGKSIQLVGLSPQSSGDLAVELIDLQVQGNSISVNSRTKIDTVSSLGTQKRLFTTDKQQRGAFFGGQSSGFGGGNTKLIHFDFTGTQVFSLSGTNTGSAETKDLAIVSNGDLYTCGRNEQDQFVQKRGKQNGKKLWQKQVFSSTSLASDLNCEADILNRSFVFGSIRDSSQSWDYTVTGYQQNGNHMGTATLDDIEGRGTQKPVVDKNIDIAVFSTQSYQFGQHQLTFYKYSQLRQPRKKQPQAQFLYQPSVPMENTSVQFDASASNDPDGTIQSYAWQFGDGTGGQGQQPSHKYATADNYTVSLTVTDDDGLQNTMTQTITVNATPQPPTPDDAPPVANFTISPVNPSPNQPITFDASVSYDPDGGQIDSYQWVLGDGSKARQATTTHAYDDSGQYYVWLMLTDDEQDSAGTMQPVCVGNAQCGGSSQQLVQLESGWNIMYMHTQASVPINVVRNKCSNPVAMTLVNGSLEREGSQLESGESYLLRVDNQCEIKGTAIQLSQDQLTFNAGWNLVGVTQSMPLSSLEDSCGEDIVVFGINDGALYGVEDTIQPKEGYLVRTDSDCTHTFP